MPYRVRPSVWYNFPGLVAAWQPVACPAGALAARQNVANDGRTAGVYAATPGVAPGFDARSGWAFNGSDQYLETGITPAYDTQGWSALVSYADWTLGSYTMLFGAFFGESGTREFNVGRNGSYSIANHGILNSVTLPATGVVGFASTAGYVDGSMVGTLNSPGLYEARRLLIGAATYYNTNTAYYFANVRIRALAIWRRTLSAAEAQQASRQMAWAHINPDWNAWGRRRRYFYAPADATPPPVEEPIPPSGRIGLRLHLLDRTGTTYVNFLDGATDRRYLAELNGVGAGSFAINANDPKAADIAAQQIVRVDLGNETVGHWLIERIEEIMIDAGEDTSNTIQVSGRGVLTQLDRAVIYADGYPGEPSTDVELAFAPSFGDGWFAVLNSQVDLPFGFSFDVDDDSAGDPWDDVVDTSFQCNATMLEVMQTMAALGIDMLLEPGSLSMAAYPAPAGDDLTASVIFRQGRDVQKLKRTTFSGDLVNCVMAIEGLITYTQYLDTTSETAYGRLQTGIDVSNKSDPDKRAGVLRDRLAYPLVTTDLVVNTATYTPFLDYALGDTITLWTNRVRDEFRVKAIQIDQADADELGVALQLSDRAMSFLERLNVSLRRSELSLARVYGVQDG